MLNAFSNDRIFTFLPLLLVAKGIDAKTIGSFALGFTLGSFVGKMACGRLIDIFGTRKIFIIAGIILALLLCALLQSNNLILTVIISLAIGIVTKGTVPVIQTIITEPVRGATVYDAIFSLNSFGRGIINMRTRQPEAYRQMTAFLETLTRASDVKFIVLIDMQGIRLFHPDSAKIGQHFMGGDEGKALEGQSYLSSARGTFGFSLRAFRPIFDAQGNQLGAASAGILSSDIEAGVARLTGPLGWLLALSLVIGIVLAVLLSRTIKKILFGLEPHQIARLLEERNAILRTTREGIIAVNKNGTLVLVNEMAEKILRSAGVFGPLEGQPVQSAIPGTRLDAVVREGRPEYDQEQNINSSVVLTNRVPILVQGEIIGAVATFRDMVMNTGIFSSQHFEYRG